MITEERFKEYLISKGYKEFTPSGKPSTAYDYTKRVINVCEWESLTLTELANNIEETLKQYEEGGSKAELGSKSHNAFRCALRAFKGFVEDNK